MEPRAKDDEFFVVECVTSKEKKTVYKYFGYKTTTYDDIKYYDPYDDVVVGRLKTLYDHKIYSIFTKRLNNPRKYVPYEQITYEEFETRYLNIENIDCFEIIKKMNQGEQQ